MTGNCQGICCVRQGLTGYSIVQLFKAGVATNHHSHLHAGGGPLRAWMLRACVVNGRVGYFGHLVSLSSLFVGSCVPKTAVSSCFRGTGTHCSDPPTFLGFILCGSRPSCFGQGVCQGGHSHGLLVSLLIHHSHLFAGGDPRCTWLVCAYGRGGVLCTFMPLSSLHRRHLPYLPLQVTFRFPP